MLCCNTFGLFHTHSGTHYFHHSMTLPFWSCHMPRPNSLKDSSFRDNSDLRTLYILAYSEIHRSIFRCLTPKNLDSEKTSESVLKKVTPEKFCFGVSGAGFPVQSWPRDTPEKDLVLTSFFWFRRRRANVSPLYRVVVSGQLFEIPETTCTQTDTDSL